MTDLRDMEREACVSWLSTEYPNAWPREKAEHAWDHGHVFALAWNRRAALAAHAAPGVDRGSCAEAPAGYESTTICYTRYVSPARYANFSAEVQKWYRPYWTPTAAQPVAPPYVTHLDQIDAEKEARDWLNAMIPTDRRRAFWQWETFSFSLQDGRVHLLRAHERPVAAALIVRDGLNRSQFLRWTAAQADTQGGKRSLAADLDCRTCGHWTPHHRSDVMHCSSPLRCVAGSSYQRQGVVQLWEAAPVDAGF